MCVVPAERPAPHRQFQRRVSPRSKRPGRSSRTRIDWLRRVVHVRRQVRIVSGQLVYSPPKGGKQRDIPLPESVGLVLAEHIRSNGTVNISLPWTEPGGKPQSHGLLFTSTAGRAVDRNAFNRRWRAALAAAGIPRGREHGFHIRGTPSPAHCWPAAWMSGR